MCVLVVVMVTLLSGGNHVRVSGCHGNSLHLFCSSLLSGVVDITPETRLPARRV